MTHSGRISTSETGRQICRIHAERTAAFHGPCLESRQSGYGPTNGKTLSVRCAYKHSDERKGFIDGALDPPSHLWATTSDVDAVSEHNRAHAMPRREHRRISLPSISCWIVSLILTEYPVGALPTHTEDAIAIPSDAVPRTRCRDWCAKAPLVRARIIRVVEARVGMEGIHAAADQVDDTVHGDDAGMVAPDRHWLAARISVSLSMVHDMPVDGAAVLRTYRAADQVDLTFQCDASNGPADLGQPLKRVPAAGFIGEGPVGEACGSALESRQRHRGGHRGYQLRPRDWRRAGAAAAPPRHSHPDHRRGDRGGRHTARRAPADEVMRPL